MNFLKKYHCVKQHDIQDCGPSCLATICRQYGLKMPVSVIREYAGTDLEGTTIFGMIQAAQRLGFSAEAVSVDTQNEIFDNLNVPLVAHVITKDMLSHYMVIQKITPKYILVSDPASGLKKYNVSEFFEIWTGILILLSPNENFKTGNQTKGIFKRFWNLIFRQKRLLLAIFFSSIIITVFGMAGSFYYKF